MAVRFAVGLAALLVEVVSFIVATGAHVLGMCWLEAIGNTLYCA
jgi:hypothetical protein